MTEGSTECDGAGCGRTTRGVGRYCCPACVERNVLGGLHVLGHSQECNDLNGWPCDTGVDNDVEGG